MRQRPISVVLAAGLLIAFAGCRTAPIQTIAGERYSPSPSASTEEIKNAIERAGAGLGWTVVEAEPGKLRGTLRLRSHVVVVDIPYDRESFDIHYVSSENMLHSGDQIHKQYNNWINNLARVIREEVSAL